jgi:hypothetical protein
VYVYDAGALVAAERGSVMFTKMHERAGLAGQVPIVPAPVLAQVWRRGPQDRLSRVLRGCAVVPMEEALARRVGELLGESKTSDVVDATVVMLAAALPHLAVVTSDPGDLRRLAAALDVRLRLLTV